MLKAQEMEAELAEEERVCNDTMMALWEECKPCLKNTCVKYYSRTCSSGSGMVGHQVRTPCSGRVRRDSGSDIWFSPPPRLQLEDVLNRTHPFSIWINGEKVDTLQQQGKRQKEEFSQLEEKYAEMADGVDSIFSDSMKVSTTGLMRDGRRLVANAEVTAGKTRPCRLSGGSTCTEQPPPIFPTALGQKHPISVPGTFLQFPKPFPPHAELQQEPFRFHGLPDGLRHGRDS